MLKKRKRYVRIIADAVITNRNLGGEYCLKGGVVLNTVNNYVELSFSDIRETVQKVVSFDAQQSGADVVLTSLLRSVKFEIILSGVVTSSEHVFIEDIEGAENAPCVKCLVFDENGESCEGESMYPLKIRGKAYLYDYGPAEKESALLDDYLGAFITGLSEKEKYLGVRYMNEAEALLFEKRRFYLLLYMEDAAGFGREYFKDLKAYVEDGSSFAKAIDKCIEEDMGLIGRKNLSSFKKELKKYKREVFDRDGFISLCRKAVEDFPCVIEKERKEVYDKICSYVSEFMKESGYGGKYPCFKNGEKYINFGYEFEDGEFGFYSRFGIVGKKAKKYKCLWTCDKLYCLLDLNGEFNDEVKSGLSFYLNGICDALDGKKVSKEFKESFTFPAGEKKITGRPIGIICILLSLCLAGVIFAVALQSEGGFAFALSPNKLNTVLGLASSGVLFVFGLFMTFPKERGRLLQTDKGDLI